MFAADMEIDEACVFTWSGEVMEDAAEGGRESWDVVFVILYGKALALETEAMEARVGEAIDCR